MRRIALVEDNADNRLLVQALLGGRYEITEYETGIDALNGIKASPPDLILLDISLPEMDGTQVLEELRKSESTSAIPAIALTAHAMAGDREKYLALGFDDYITKPILDAGAMIACIDELMGES